MDWKRHRRDISCTEKKDTSWFLEATITLICIEVVRMGVSTVTVEVSVME